MNANILQVPVDEEGNLLCAHEDCRHFCLHHTHVNVFSRKEDAPTKLTTVSGETVTVGPDRDNQNPSSRRDAVSIRFGCEDCNRISTLVISQHKGFTHMRYIASAEEWNPDPNSEHGWAKSMHGFYA